MPGVRGTPEQIDPGMRSKAKMINYGIVYGLSAWGMADRLDIPQKRPTSSSSATWPASRRWRGGSRTRSPRGPSTATSRLVRPPPPGARAPGEALGAAQAGRAVRGQHGDPGNRSRHHEGRDGPLRPGAQGGRAPDDPPDPRRAAVRRPRRGGRGGQGSPPREMEGAFEMDPPLAVEAGIGPDWLAAK